MLMGVEPMQLDDDDDDDVLDSQQNSAYYIELQVFTTSGGARKR